MNMNLRTAIAMRSSDLHPNVEGLGHLRWLNLERGTIDHPIALQGVAQCKSNVAGSSRWNVMSIVLNQEI